MTAPDALLHYDVTRAAIIAALGNLPLTAYLNLEARGKFADALLAQMPEASPLVTEDQAREIMQATVAEGIGPIIDAELAKVEAAVRASERKRAEAEHAEYLSRLTEEMDETLRAERDRIIALAERCFATCQDQNGDSYPFADAIREHL